MSSSSMPAPDQAAPPQQTDLNTTSEEAYALLMRRRSLVAKTMVGPAPDRATVEKIISAGMRVPDHGKLSPWRFIVIEGDDRAKLDGLINDGLDRIPDDSKAQKARNYASQGPMFVTVIYSPSDQKPIPRWEQALSAGAVCQNMLVAATALGVASQWLTGWPSYDEGIKAALELHDDEEIAGLIFLGYQDKPPRERERPRLEDKVIWGLPCSSNL